MELIETSSLSLSLTGQGSEMHRTVENGIAGDLSSNLSKTRTKSLKLFLKEHVKNVRHRIWQEMLVVLKTEGVYAEANGTIFIFCHVAAYWRSCHLA